MQDSYQSEDGTVKCVLNCPIIGCNESHTVSYKNDGYKSSYKLKKKSADEQSRTPPRWNLYNTQKHICSHHGQGIPIPHARQPNGGDEASPRFAENQNEDSTSQIANDDTHVDMNDSEFLNDSTQVDMSRNPQRSLRKRTLPNNELQQHAKRTRYRK